MALASGPKTDPKMINAVVIVETDSCKTLIPTPTKTGPKFLVLPFGTFLAFLSTDNVLSITRKISGPIFDTIELHD